MKESLKKSLALLLMVVMVLGASPLSGIGGLDLHLPKSLKSPFSVDADAANVSEITYLISEGKVTITDCNTSASGALTIPATIEGCPVTSIGDRAFYNCTSLESIIIPSGVTSIGMEAFCECFSLESIAIPSGVTSIDDKVFEDCYSLTSITVAADNACYSSDERGVLLNKNKTELIRYPEGNTATSYTIPSGVTSIGEYAFCYCSSLESIIIPSGVTSIGDYAFPSCSSLEGIEIPSGVTSIGNNAFHRCDSLESVSFGENSQLTGIGDYAFSSCSSLEAIEIPSGVTSVGEQAFYDCSSLESITVAADNASYSSDERGALFNKNKTELIQYPEGNTTASYTIPSGVTSIGEYAFCYCSSLESIIIPSGVTSIGDKAFSDCDSLESITIPSGVTSIGNGAFDSCYSLTSIIIPSGVTVIGYGAFSWCENLANIEIPSGVTSIGNSAFYDTDYYNNSLNWVDDVLYIGEYLIDAKSSISGSYAVKPGTKLIADGAFKYCSSLESITVAADNASYLSDERGVLYNKNKTILIQYPRGNTATSYTIPSGVTSIGEYAFCYCSSLEAIEIPSGVTSIGDAAFSNCGGLANIEIPSGVTSVGDFAFYDCSSLASVIIPSGVTSIGDYAFSGYSSLTRLHIPPSVTRIGSNLLSSGSECIICSTTETAYAKTYADNNDFTFEVCTTGITVSPTSETLAVGETASLTATVIPENATNKAVTWSSSNNAVATVSVAGVVTAVSPGTATITVTTADRSKTATCAITVSNPTITIKNLNNSASINYGDTLRLTAVTTDMPAGAKVVWSVDGTGVSLNASDDGRTCDITSTASGTVTVTAKIVDASGTPITDADENEISVSQQIKSNAGFFQKLIAFFKKLFGSTKIIVQSFIDD